MNNINIKKILFYFLIGLILIIQVYPIFWIITSSLKNTVDFSNNPFSLPSDLTIKNYLNAWRQGNIGLYFKNSIIVTFSSIILIVFLSSMAGFAMEKLRFKYSNALLILFLSGIMVPIQVTLIPLFNIYKEINILNSYLSLILPQVGFALPISVYLFVSFYKYIPDEITEAAIIDGCSVYQLYFKMILPMSKNTVVTVVAMNSIFIWNDFIFANTFISDRSLKTITVGLQDFIGAYGLTDWGATFAAIALTTLPTLIVYFTLNKSVIKGMAAGATKG